MKPLDKRTLRRGRDALSEVIAEAPRTATVAKMVLNDACETINFWIDRDECERAAKRSEQPDEALAATGWMV